MSSSTLKPEVTDTTVLLFTWAAGAVDALMYLSAHVFTANMTGNTVLLGLSLGKPSALKCCAPSSHSLDSLLARP
jgi:uncharacterized membrane protein YoaK (UPF0700 family)